MDFSIPAALSEELGHFQEFIKSHLKSELSVWNKSKEISRQFFQALGDGSWYGLESKNGELSKGSALREALLAEAVAKVSPGVAIAILAHIDLGLSGVYLSGSKPIRKKIGIPAIEGKTIMCLGNTENIELPGQSL